MICKGCRGSVVFGVFVFGVFRQGDYFCSRDCALGIKRVYEAQEMELRINGDILDTLLGDFVVLDASQPEPSLSKWLKEVLDDE